MLFADTLIYFILAWYSNNVAPREYGRHLPFYFPFTKSYWFPDKVESRDKSKIDIEDKVADTYVVPAESSVGERISDSKRDKTKDYFEELNLEEQQLVRIEDKTN